MPDRRDSAYFGCLLAGLLLASGCSSAAPPQSGPPRTTRTTGEAPVGSLAFGFHLGESLSRAASSCARKGGLWRAGELNHPDILQCDFSPGVAATVPTNGWKHLDTRRIHLAFAGGRLVAVGARGIGAKLFDEFLEHFPVRTRTSRGEGSSGVHWAAYEYSESPAWGIARVRIVFSPGEGGRGPVTLWLEASGPPGFSMPVW